MMTFNLRYTGANTSLNPNDYEFTITSINVEIYSSDDSTNGIDGTWDLISDVALKGRLNDLQKVDIPQSVSEKWFRVVFVNNETVDVALTEVAMYEFLTTGNNNYFLLLGASIMERSGGQSEFINQLDDVFEEGHGYDPVIFNLAVSGTEVSDLESSIDDDLANHPKAAFVLIHIEKVIDAGKTPVLARLTFRDYKNNPQVNAGLNQAYGSLPYNWLLDDVIEDYTPDYYDPVSERGRIDFYELTLNDQAILANDGIHPAGGQGSKIINYWVSTAFKYLYTGEHNDTMLHTETISNLEDSVTTLISIAESTMDVSDVWEARLIADQIADHSDRIVAHEELNAILGGPSLPVNLLDFTYEILQNKTALNWTTTAEYNNDYFSIEKSFDNISWYLLTNDIKGKEESNTLETYEFEDFDQLNRSCYYRLSQTDLDGQGEILETLFVRKSDEIELSLYPNPTTNEFRLSNSQDVNFDQIEMFTLSGVRVPLEVTSNKISFTTSVSGVFFVKIPYYNTVIYRSLIVE